MGKVVNKIVGEDMNWPIIGDTDGTGTRNVTTFDPSEVVIVTQKESTIEVVFKNGRSIKFTETGNINFESICNVIESAKKTI
jgi:hypothetical protein